jgi:nitroimidazol reductase NimA-like FMN-containing flavoprotein (pyridoxamine 5'-phosphate oxidase superfamily)
MADDTFTARTRVMRKPERAHYDREAIHAILDAARICHVGLVRDGLPVVLPTIHARDGDTVLLHGSTGAGFVRDAKKGTPLCISVTIVDGLVLSRAVRNHSMNYRSAVIFGEGVLLRDDAEKLRALEIITDRLVPGRWPATRPPTGQELRETAVVSVPIREASAKIRTGGPTDTDADGAVTAWAGVIPLVTSYGRPEPAPFCPAGAAPPSW